MAVLMVPELVVLPLDGLVEGRRRDLLVGAELVHDRLGGLGELLVVEIDGGVVLLVEVVDPAGGVAVGADLLHVAAPLLPILEMDGDDRAQRVAMRSPTSWVTFCVAVALMWQVAQVGAAE